MKVNKKGQLGSDTASKYIFLFVITVVVLQVVASLLPEAQTAGDNLSDEGVPLGGLFASDGVLWIIVMAGLLILMVRSYMNKK
jgi:hypothetical protein